MSPKPESGSRKATLSWIAGAACTLLAIAWWAWGETKGANPPTAFARPAPSAAAGTREPAATPLAPPVGEPRASEPVNARTTARETEAKGGSKAQLASEPASPFATAILLAKFVGPDRSRIELEHARVVLRGEDEVAREIDASGSTLRVEGLAPGHYVLEVHARDIDHYPQLVDLKDPERAQGFSSERHEAMFEEDVVLWPSGWVAVLVATPDGRPFEQLAQELELEPKRIFVDAFEVRTRREPPDDEAWNDEEGTHPAVFRKPQTYQQWELPGSAVGSLQVLESPPFWVGLKVLGVPLGWEMLAPGAHEVTFHLDLAELSDRFARLRLRIVDDKTGAGASDARVTLRADTSAHRRKEHQDVAPDDDGEVLLDRLMPGRYEVAIARGAALRQEFVVLAPAEVRDLGDLALGLGVPIELHVVDAGGALRTAWIEIGPYRRGASENELYPPNWNRFTERPGTGHIPAPSAPSIIRVDGCEVDSTSTGERSASVLIDPEHLPRGPITLVLHWPVDVTFDAVPADAASVEVDDELDLVVARAAARGKEPIKIELIAGRYRARMVGAAGESLGEMPFSVADAPMSVPLR